MAKKKTGQKKSASTTKQKTKKKIDKKFKKNIIAAPITAIILLIIIVISTGIAVKYLIPVPESSNNETIISDHKSEKKTHTYEIFPEPDDSHTPIYHNIPVNPHKKPEVAIIIDDIGYKPELAKKFYKLGINITLSILPQTPHTRSIADDAHKNGVQIMLHLPMEPSEYPRINSGPGSLLMSMSPDELIHQLKIDLEKVPYIVGVNNHMGSRLTSISSRMYQIFSIIKKRKIFFIDSRTTSKSICRPSAKLFQIPYAERDIFLDNTQSKKSIGIQMDRLIKKAEKNGSAIGIGHPHSITYKVIAEKARKYKSRVKFVYASELVKIQKDKI